MQKTSLYLIMLLALLTACGNSEKTYKIGVAQCSQGRWREKVNREMLAAQHLFEHDVKVMIANSHDDTDWQIRQIDSLGATDIDLLVVAPNEAAPVAEAVARVRAKGIPVIFFDRKADTDDYTAFIGGNNVEAGKTIGDYAMMLAHKTVLEITGTMATSPARDRHKGFEKVMQKHPEMDYVSIQGSWSAEEVQKIVRQQLAAGKRPDVIFCHSDFMAEGAYQALKEAGLAGQVKVLGIDGMPDEGIMYIQQGHLAGTYIYPTHGEKVVRLALDILTGQSYERDNYLQSMMVTPENADMVAMNSNELLQQGKDLITIQDKLEEYFGLYNNQHKLLIGSVVLILLLLIAMIMIWRAYIQTRKANKQRQDLNVEEVLFYTNPDSRKLRQVFDPQPEESPAPRSQDTIFAETLNEAIRKHMSNPDLKMDDLGDELGISRVQLYRRVKTITGLSPVELLRQMRLQRGYTLVGTTNKTIAEIAHEVGFQTPSYFSNCFKKQFGKYPTELRSE